MEEKISDVVRCFAKASRYLNLSIIRWLRVLRSEAAANAGNECLQIQVLATSIKRQKSALRSLTIFAKALGLTDRFHHRLASCASDFWTHIHLELSQWAELNDSSTKLDLAKEKLAQLRKLVEYLHTRAVELDAIFNQVLKGKCAEHELRLKLFKDIAPKRKLAVSKLKCDYYISIKEFSFGLSRGDRHLGHHMTNRPAHLGKRGKVKIFSLRAIHEWYVLDVRGKLIFDPVRVSKVWNRIPAEAHVGGKVLPKVDPQPKTRKDTAHQVVSPSHLKQPAQSGSATPV